MGEPTMIDTFADTIAKMQAQNGSRPTRIVAGLEAAKQLARECYDHHNGHRPKVDQYTWEAQTIRRIEQGEMYLFGVPVEAGWLDD